MRSEDYRELLESKVSEEDVQRSIITYFTYTGYVVQQTTHRVKLCACPSCGMRFRPRGDYGATLGVADLLVAGKKWPAGMFCAIEVKGPKTRLSIEQKALHDAGRLFIARSIEDAKAIIQKFELDNGLGVR